MALVPRGGEQYPLSQVLPQPLCHFPATAPGARLLSTTGYPPQNSLCPVEEVENTQEGARAAPCGMWTMRVEAGHRLE